MLITRIFPRPVVWLSALFALPMLAALLALTAGTGALAASTAQSSTPQPTPATPATRPILLTDPAPDPQQEGVLYFPATGHTL